MNEIILIGAFNEVIELAESCNKKIAGIIDNAHKEYGKYVVLGTDEDIVDFDEDIKRKPVIITPDLPNIRQKIHRYYDTNGFLFTQLISKKAMISASAEIGEGTVVQRGVNISADVKIGDFVKLNTYSNIMHDSTVGNYTTIAPNAVILGYVKIGKCCYIGANSTVLPNVEICDNVTIGAGALVTKNITKPGTYIGTPARLMNKK